MGTHGTFQESVGFWHYSKGEESDRFSFLFSLVIFHEFNITHHEGGCFVLSGTSIERKLFLGRKVAWRVS